MYNRCSYHILHSLVPPSIEEENTIRESFLRLEHLCAYTIVKIQKHNKILSYIPLTLHKILWKAYLLEKYHSCEYAFEAIPQMLCNWPHEEFNLKKLMPNLLSKRDNFSIVWGWQDEDRKIKRPYIENKENVDDFYFNIIDKIIGYFSEQSSIECQISKLNITGYEVSLKQIIDIMESHESIFKKHIGKLEIIIDASVYMEDVYAYEDEDSTEVSHHFPISFYSSLIKFNHVSVNASFEKTNDVKLLVKTFVDNGPISINLSGLVNGSNVLENVKDCNAGNVLSIMSDCFSSLNFLAFLNNLVHLDLQHTNLHGKLSFLNNISSGLLYLNLSGCKLTNADLPYLKESCHVSTLRELSLGSNNFSYDATSNNLNELCQNLSNVLTLDLDFCRLESWSKDGMLLLSIAMINMTNIVDLDLAHNAFCSENSHVFLMKLKGNNSLRYLRLTLPLEVEKRNAQLYCEVSNQMINIDRSQLLYVEFLPHRNI